MNTKCIKCGVNDSTPGMLEMCSRCFIEQKHNHAMIAPLSEILESTPEVWAVYELHSRFSKRVERSAQEAALVTLLDHRNHIGIDGFDGFMSNTDGHGIEDLKSVLKTLGLDTAQDVLGKWPENASEEWEENFKESISDKVILDYVRQNISGLS